MSKGLIIAGIPNIMQGATCSVGGADGGAHGDQEPSSYSSAASNLPSASTFLAQSRAVLEQVNFVAIVNHNLDKAKGSYWRVWADAKAPASSNAIVGTQDLYPTSRDAITGAITGTYTAVDDNPFLSASESDYVDFGGGVSAVTFGFATPTDDPSNAGNDHAIVLRGNGTFTVTVIPGAGGTNTELCTDVTIGDEDPLARRVLILPFSTSILGSDLVSFQVKVESSVASRLYSLLWSHGYYASGTTPQFDSGWMLMTASDQGAAPYLLAPSPWLNRYEKQQTELLYIDLNTSELKYPGISPTQGLAVAAPYMAGPEVAGDAPYVYVAFLNAATDDRLNRLGVLAAGTYYQLPEERNFTGYSFGIEDASKKTPTYGGQDLPSNRHRRRRASFTLPRVPRPEQVSLSERIDIAKGITGAFLVSMYPEDDGAILTDLHTFWCTLDEAAPGGWVHTTGSVVNDNDSVPFRFERTYSVREKL